MKLPALPAAACTSPASSARLRAVVSTSARLAVISVLALTLGAFAAAPASAELHKAITGEYGKEGPVASGLGNGCSIDFQDAEDRLYLLSDEKIYGLHVDSPNTASPVGGAFPLASPYPTGCGGPEIVTDNTNLVSKGNIYAEFSGGFSEHAKLYGWTASGSALEGFPAEQPPSTQCGAAVSGIGEIWTADQSFGQFNRFTSEGAAVSDPITFAFPCHMAFDTSTENLFVLSNFRPVRILTAASGYDPEKAVNFLPMELNSGIAVNGSLHELYLTVSSGHVNVYDTRTAALVEEIDLGGPGGQSLAVDESTDVLFATMGSGAGGFIEEITPGPVPIAITGEPTGDHTMSGTAEQGNADPITSCFFEWGPGETGPYTEPPVECDESTPITGSETVHATIPGPLVKEDTYHYRLVVETAVHGFKGVGANEVVVPHYVVGLRTEQPDPISRTEATLRASYEGTNEETTYFFDWGLSSSSSFEHTTTPEIETPTTGPTVVSTPITGLVAGQSYKARVTASNAEGTSVARTITFEAAPAVKGLVTEAATEVTPGSATLNASLDPDGFETHYYFQYGKTTEYAASVPLPPGELLSSSTPGTVELHQPIANLESATTYHFRIVASNSEGTTFGQDRSFKTPQSPTIDFATSANVTANSAELIGSINPREAATTYYFEYGQTATYGARIPVPAGTLPPDDESHEVKFQLTDLANVPYHFRLVAENTWGTSASEDQTFEFAPPSTCPNHTVAQQTGAAYLPDCRAYELVTPAQANGALFGPDAPRSGYASSPGRFAFQGAFDALPGLGEPTNGAFLGDLFVATRGPEGWTTKYVGPPGSQVITSTGPPLKAGFGLGGGGGLGDMPADRSLGHYLVWGRAQATFFAAGPLEGTNAPYLYDSDGNFIRRLPTNVDEIPNSGLDMSEGGFQGDGNPSSDFSHYAFSSDNLAFAPGGLETAPGSAYDNDIAAETVSLISVLSDCEVAVDATSATSSCSDDEGNIPQDTGGGNEVILIPSVSADGSRILMTTQGSGGTHLYMRVNDSVTVEPSLGADGVNHAVHLEGMTEDGETVYFTTTAQMTPDDTDSNVDLYVWKADADTAGGGTLTRVSTGTGESGGNRASCGASWIGGCGVQVVRTGMYEPFAEPLELFATDAEPIDPTIASKSGEIFFYSPEQLDGLRGVTGGRNLYVFRDGAPQWVATLGSSESDRLVRLNVTPDGKWAAFLTSSKLGSYDNAGKREMYRYDVANRRLLCVSCRLDGEPPTNDVKGSQNGLFLTEDGRVFFNTEDALVHRDADRVYDVYEYVNARPQLISSGRSEPGQEEFRKGLTGVSANGTDVFFATYDTLVGQDENGPFLKFYDARTGGGFPFTKPPAPCAAADECHGADSSAPAPAQLGTSVNLVGGNIRHHHHGKRKRCRRKHGHKRCRRRHRHHRRHSPKKHRHSRRQRNG